MKHPSALKFFIPFLLLAGPAFAGGDLGLGYVIPRERTFDSGMFSLYADYIHKPDKSLTWRAGIDWNYGSSSSSDFNQDINYTFNGIMARGAVVWRPFDTETNTSGFYVGAGPSLIHYSLKGEIPSSGGGGGGGTRIVYSGSGGVSNLYAGLMNNIGSGSSGSTYIPAVTKTDQGTKIGAHAFIGYAWKTWHVEALYEQAPSDVMKLGGLSLRLGLRF